MLLGFKTELKVNKQQRLLLAQHAGVARHAWNQGLALCQQVFIQNQLNPDDKIKFPTAIDLHKWLVASIKSAHPWYYQVSKCAPLYGSKLVIVDRFYPSSKTCWGCGQKKISLSLSQRVFQCDSCGFECDRDLNAAINLGQESARLVALACGLDSADTSRRKQAENVSIC